MAAVMGMLTAEAIMSRAPVTQPHPLESYGPAATVPEMARQKQIRALILTRGSGRELTNKNKHTDTHFGVYFGTFGDVRNRSGQATSRALPPRGAQNY